MFDIGFWELTLIGVVALLVVGPERLPGMARTVGLYAGKMRRWVSQVRSEVERELRADEIRQAMRDAEKSETLSGVRDSMRMDDVKDAFRTAGAALKDATDVAIDPGAAAKPAGETKTPAADEIAQAQPPAAAPSAPESTASAADAAVSEPGKGAETAAAESEGGRERGAG